MDLVRNRVRIVERATEVGGRMDVDAPKSLAPARQVAIPEFLREVLAARIEGRDWPTWCSRPGGGYLRNGNWRNRSGWNEATQALGLAGITPP